MNMIIECFCFPTFPHLSSLHSASARSQISSPAFCASITWASSQHPSISGCWTSVTPGRNGLKHVETCWNMLKHVETTHYHHSPQNLWHAIRWSQMMKWWSQMISDDLRSGGRIPPRLEAVPEVVELFPASRLVLTRQGPGPRPSLGTTWYDHWARRDAGVLCRAEIRHGPLHWEARIPSECLAFRVFQHASSGCWYVLINTVQRLEKVWAKWGIFHHGLTKNFEEIVPLAELRQTPEWKNVWNCEKCSKSMQILLNGHGNVNPGLINLWAV